MKPFAAFSIAACFVTTSLAEEAGKLDVLEMKSVPEGRYAVTYQLDGEAVEAELVVKNDVARCVKSEPAPGGRVLKGATGTFQLLANGVFMIALRGDNYTGTQFWAFKPDGSAVIKEIPDRGEKQRAVPVREV